MFSSSSIPSSQAPFTTAAAAAAAFTSITTESVSGLAHGHPRPHNHAHENENGMHSPSPSSSESGSDEVYKESVGSGDEEYYLVGGARAGTTGGMVTTGMIPPMTPDATPPSTHESFASSNSNVKTIATTTTASPPATASSSNSDAVVVGLGITGLITPISSPPRASTPLASSLPTPKKNFDPFAPLEPSPFTPQTPSVRLLNPSSAALGSATNDFFGPSSSIPNTPLTATTTIGKARPTSLYIPMEEDEYRIGKSGNTPTWPFNRETEGRLGVGAGGDADKLFVGRGGTSFEMDRKGSLGSSSSSIGAISRSSSPGLGYGLHTPSQGGFESDIPYSPSAKSSPPPSTPSYTTHPKPRHSHRLSHLRQTLSNPTLLSALDSPTSWIILYFFFNLGLTLFNKLVLQGFPFPWTLTGIQMLSGTLGTQVALSAGFFKKARLTQGEGLIMLAFSGLYTVNIAVSNLSLHLVTVPFHQVVRATTPIFTIIVSIICFSKSYSKNIYLSLLPVVLGVASATYGDYYFTPYGLFLTLLGTLLAALKTIVTNKVQVGRLKLHPLDLLIRMSPLAFVQCVAWGWYSGELERVRAYGAMEMTKSKALALAMNGFLAFGLNVVSFTANKKTSALTMTVAANVKQVLTIVLAVLIFNLVLNPTNLFGIFLTLVGGAVYGRVESMEKAKVAAGPKIVSVEGERKKLVM